MLKKCLRSLVAADEEGLLDRDAFNGCFNQ